MPIFGQNKGRLQKFISFELKQLQQCFWCLWKAMIMGFQEIYNLKHHFEFPIGKFWFKIGKIGKYRDFFVGGPKMKIFEIQLFEHFFTIKMSVMSKFESKRSKSLDFIAYSVFKDFDQKNSILRATVHPKMPIDFERNHLHA